VQEQVLSDPAQRAVYDEIHGYTATAANPFFDDNAPRDQVFVDEFTCIGMLINLSWPGFFLTCGMVSIILLFFM
jgi:hypothetical protein